MFDILLVRQTPTTSPCDVLRFLPGAATLSSLLSPSWLRRVFRTSRDPDGSSSSDDDSGDDSDEIDGGGGGGEGETVAAGPTSAPSPPLASPPLASPSPSPSSPAARYAAQAEKRDGNPFDVRIAAHAGCTKKLWRARYLALREVRAAILAELSLVVSRARVLLYCSGSGRGGGGGGGGGGLGGSSGVGAGGFRHTL